MENYCFKTTSHDVKNLEVETNQWMNQLNKVINDLNNYYKWLMIKCNNKMMNEWK